jgi:hypothetical protein
VKEVTQAPQGTIVVIVNEYIDVDGVKFPAKITQSVGPQSFDIKVDSIEVNTDIDESKFKI